MRNGSITPREEGFAKQTQVMLLGRWLVEDVESSEAWHSPDAIVLMTVSEAFLIFVDDILSLYLLAPPYSCTGIKQLPQICIYMLFRAVTLV